MSPEGAPTAEWPDARILAVDDVPDYLGLLEIRLARAGYSSVHTTTDPSQLLDWFRSEEPDLVLLDLHMSEMDGFELIERLHEATPDRHHVPILAVTGDQSDVVRQRALQLGAHDFLDKMLDATEVGLRIRNLLRTRAQHLELRRREERLEDEVQAQGADLELYLHVLESINDAVIIEDPTTQRVVYLNSALAGVVGRDLHGAVWTDGHLAERASAVLVGEVAVVTFEGVLERNDGSVVPVDVVVQGMSHGGRDLLIGVARDVSARKEAEDALARAAARERDAADHLRRLDDLKNSLLSAVNHELRTPLTSILGVAKTLQARPPTGEMLEALTPPLVRNAEELQKLLDDLLDIDRVMNGTAGFQPDAVDLAALVLGVVEATPLEGRRLLVDVQPTEAIVDPVRFERIVSNLLRNAVRHTPEETTIEVRLVSGDPVRLTVSDDGPGVPDDLKGHVFEPFTQGALRDPHQPGTGVGLSLVRTFVELHGGRVWVEDTDEGGATFQVEIPATGPPASGGGHSSRSTTQSTQAV